jgi:hypothetical protein
LCIDCQKVVTPKLALPIQAILGVNTICGTHARPVLEVKSNIIARTNLRLLSKFEGVGVLGLVWDTGFILPFGERRVEHFINAASNSREEVHAFLKGAFYWADDDLPDVHILNKRGERVERSQ